MSKVELDDLGFPIINGNPALDKLKEDLIASITKTTELEDRLAVVEEKTADISAEPKEIVK